MNKGKKEKDKIIVILGTNASGKTRLGVQLAYKFNGEIVSADSRQVYKEMDVGTGKDLEDFRFQISDFRFSKKSRGGKINKYIQIPYHLIDIVSPKTEFNLAKYQKLAYKAIDDILAWEKLPIIVGGTGLYVQTIVNGYKLSRAKPDKKLREKLEKLDRERLFKKLEKLNPGFAKRLNESDKKNKRRLIRYLEIAESRMTTLRQAQDRPFSSVQGRPFSSVQGRLAQMDTNLKASGHEFGEQLKRYNALLIGLTWSKQVLHKRIYQRLIKRLEKEDMIREVERLYKQGVGWQRLEDFGLEYKYIALYLQEKLDYDQMVEQLFIAIKKFAKRQMTWFRRWEKQGAKICWVENSREAEKLVKEFLKLK